MSTKIGVSAICVLMIVFACDWTAYSAGIYWSIWLEIKILVLSVLIVLPVVLVRTRVIRIDDFSSATFERQKIDVARLQVRLWSVGAIMGGVGSLYFSHGQQVWGDFEMALLTLKSSALLAFFYISVLFLSHFINVLRVGLRD